MVVGSCRRMVPGAGQPRERGDGPGQRVAARERVRAAGARLRSIAGMRRVGAGLSRGVVTTSRASVLARLYPEDAGVPVLRSARERAATRSVVSGRVRRSGRNDLRGQRSTSLVDGGLLERRSAQTARAIRGQSRTRTPSFTDLTDR